MFLYIILQKLGERKKTLPNNDNRPSHLTELIIFQSPYVFIVMCLLQKERLRKQVRHWAESSLRPSIRTTGSCLGIFTLVLMQRGWQTGQALKHPLQWYGPIKLAKSRKLEYHYPQNLYLFSSNYLLAGKKKTWHKRPSQLSAWNTLYQSILFS